MKLKIFMNKKGDMPWWLTRWIIVIAILVFVLYMIYASRKGISLNIIEIFKRW